MADAAKVTHDELVSRARDLRRVLSERTIEADELRRIPDKTIADFHEAGFFRMLQPKRWGGLEVHPRTFFDVQMEIAKGCPSSAWVLGVVAVHKWQLGLFAEQAQLDVWGNGSRTLISSSYAPTGKIERVQRGFKVSGRWSFSSGCDHCDWVFLGGFAPPAAGGSDGPPDMRTYLLPKSDYRIDDNWQVMGLKGTGSKDIVVDGAFVPEHRTHRLIDGFRCKSPGNELNTSPLFRLPFGQIFVRSVSSTAIGIAERALEAFTSTAAKRIAAGDQSKVAVDPTVQRLAADAAAVIDEVKLVLYRNMDELMTYAEKGEVAPLDRRVRFRFDSSNAADRCAKMVNLLFTESGGRAIFLGNPLLRAWLDINAARAHYANNPEKPGRNFGGVQLDLKNADFFL
jgi:3-hydroxy-9,10-secoandrosta-1,3,5(10)-triene-9,17-dione monooxygenase